MRLLKSNWQVLVLPSLFSLMLSANSLAQEKPNLSERPASGRAKALPAKGSRPAGQAANAEERSVSGTPGEREDDADQILKREEWFYKQRSSANGHIPAGARLKAFQHMQRMMVAEGKLTLRPDGSYAEVTPQSFLSPLGAVTSPWLSIGPTPTTGGFFSPVTGRITTIAVDPSDSTGNTVLIGGAMGGIWRSTDAGATWTPVGDQNASLAMGSIAFAPSNTSIVYAGTGEQASIGFDIYYGAGVLKSTDHGQTWTQTCTPAGPTCPFIGPYLDSLHPGFGFFNFGGARISYIAVNPQNPNLVLVAAQLGIEGPTEGIYCSSDAGAHWTNIFPDEMATFVGFASPTVAFAAFGMPFGSSPGAPHGNGIYKSTNANSCSANFTPLTTGLPAQSTIGRIDMGISQNYVSDNTVYASIANGQQASTTDLGVWVTTNGGTSWTQTNAPDVCQHQCWYDNVIKVDPNNKNVAFFGGGAVRDSGGNPFWVVRTEDGGTTWSSVIPNLPAGSAGLPHVDNHAIAFFKATSGTFAGKVRMYLGNDGGVWRTDDAEASTIIWTNLNNPSLTLTQFYPAISIHATAPSIAFGGAQDNGSQNYQGPSVGWTDNQLCGDGGSTATDAFIPSTVYIGCATGVPVSASYQDGTIGTFFPAVNGINPNDLQSFITPIVTDPNLPSVVYFAADTVYESVDAGNTWTPISGNIGSPSNGIINALAVGSTSSSVIYAGLSNGTVELEVNANSGTFANFSPVLGQGALPNRAVTSIAVDASDTSGKTAYVAYSGFSYVGPDALNPNITIADPQGHIFKTTDEGNTWTDISCSVAAPSNCSTPAASDLPNIPVNDVVIDPDLPGTLYAATDLGVFIGNCSASPCTWSTLSTGLPRAAVLSLRLHEPSRTLRAATHGRGAWDINLNNFTFTGPHISSISPPSANAGTSNALTLTVNGSGLTNGAVQWNGSASNVTTTQVSDTKLTASIAVSLLATAGTPKITVVNGTQTSNAMTFAVLASTPTFTSISPSSTPVQTPNPTTAVPIQLTGTNFSNNAKVLFNGAQSGITVAAPTTSCPLPTCLSATLPAALLGPYGGTNDISVLNLPPGGGQSKPQTFKVVAPPPTNDNFSNAFNIPVLSFTDFVDTSGATTELTDPTPPCVHQSTPAQGNTGGHPNGAYNTIWYKYTPVFSANLEVDTIGSTFDTVLSIWTGSAGSLTNVACNDDIVPGVNIQSRLVPVPLTAGTTYYIMVSSFGPPDPNPIALGGKTIFNFSYNAGNNPSPSVTSLTPSTAKSGDPSFTLTVNGSGFLNGATVHFENGFVSPNPEPTTFVSSTQLTAAIPASDINLPGSRTVFVANPPPGGSPANALTFTVTVGTYPVPVLNSINPTSAISGTILPVTILAGGANFASTAVLNFNGVPQSTSPLNPSQVQATISPSALASPATVQVTVSNPSPGGGPSNSLPFTIVMPNPVPTITSLTPSSAAAGSSITPIAINGTNFQQGALVYLNGDSFNQFVTTPSFVSSTQLTINVFLTNFNAGTFSVVVGDPPPGGFSNAATFTVTGPPDFSISASSTTTQTVNAGQTATFTNAITVTPQSGFASQVNLSCSLPLTATHTTCTVNPNSLASGSGMASVSVTTMAHSIAPPPFPTGRFRLRPEWVPLFLTALLFAVVFMHLARTRRQRLVGALPLAVVILFLLLQAIGCGGGYTPPPPTGTPAGTYTITVTGTSGNLTHTTTLTLTVN